MMTMAAEIGVCVGAKALTYPGRIYQCQVGHGTTALIVLDSCPPSDRLEVAISGVHAVDSHGWISAVVWIVHNSLLIGPRRPVLLYAGDLWPYPTVIPFLPTPPGQDGPTVLAMRIVELAGTP